MNIEHQLFIAETNERGDVIWVWRKSEGSGPARPIRHPSRHLTSVETAQVSGAPRAAIIQWLSQH